MRIPNCYLTAKDLRNIILAVDQFYEKALGLRAVGQTTREVQICDIESGITDVCQFCFAFNRTQYSESLTGLIPPYPNGCLFVENPERHTGVFSKCQFSLKFQKDHWQSEADYKKTERNIKRSILRLLEQCEYVNIKRQTVEKAFVSELVLSELKKDGIICADLFPREQTRGIYVLRVGSLKYELA